MVLLPTAPTYSKLWKDWSNQVGKISVNLVSWRIRFIRCLNPLFCMQIWIQAPNRCDSLSEVLLSLCFEESNSLFWFFFRSFFVKSMNKQKKMVTNLFGKKKKNAKTSAFFRSFLSSFIAAQSSPLFWLANFFGLLTRYCNGTTFHGIITEKYYFPLYYL